MTSPAQRVHADAVDAQGMSIATANLSTMDSRLGRVWHPDRFAAGVPIHFHPLASPQFVGLFSERWYSAQINSTAYGQYVSKSVDTDPAWMLINANTGDSSAVNQQVGTDPFDVSYVLPAVTKTLRSATSQGIYLYGLTRLDGAVVLSRWRSTKQNQLITMHEEVMPTGTASVVWDGGIYIDRDFIYAWGTDNGNNVYTCRQMWGKVGDPTDYWQYQTDTGWSNDPTQATPVPVLRSAGPMSTFIWRDRTYTTTVAHESNDYVGQVWLSKHLSDPWTKVLDVDLGTDATYAGAGIVLQPQLGVGPSVMTAYPGMITAVPFVTARVDANAIDVHWDVLPIPA